MLKQTGFWPVTSSLDSSSELDFSQKEDNGFLWTSQVILGLQLFHAEKSKWANSCTTLENKNARILLVDAINIQPSVSSRQLNASGHEHCCLASKRRRMRTERRRSLGKRAQSSGIFQERLCRCRRTPYVCIDILHYRSLGFKNF